MTPEEIQAAEEQKAKEAELLKQQEEEDDKKALTPEEYEKKIAELETQKDKWKSRFQRNTKKIDTTKEQTNPNIEETVRNVLSQERAKDTLLNNFTDAKDKWEEIEKVAKAKNLSVDEAYKLIKFDELNSGKNAYSVHGEFSKPAQGPVDDIEKLLQTPNKTGNSVWADLKK